GVGRRRSEVPAPIDVDQHGVDPGFQHAAACTDRDRAIPTDRDPEASIVKRGGDRTGNAPRPLHRGVEIVDEVSVMRGAVDLPATGSEIATIVKAAGVQCESVGETGLAHGGRSLLLTGPVGAGAAGNTEQMDGAIHRCLQWCYLCLSTT